MRARAALRLALVGCAAALSAAGAAARAQQAGLTVVALEATHANGTLYRFPLVEGDSLAASRIDTWLQVVELDLLPGHQKVSVFEGVWPEAGSHHGVTELDYSTSSDPPGILLVAIRGFALGAYESPIGGQHYFDARSGELITARSLFSSESLAALDAEIVKSRLERVDDFLSGKTLADGALLRDDPAEREEQRELYRECRIWIEKSRPAVSDELRLAPDRLTWLREPCAPHAQQALDEVDRAESRSFESLAPRMNDYGRCLLVERKTDCQRGYAWIAPGVYRGKIAERYAITLVVEAADPKGPVRARYFYDEHGTAIVANGAAAEGGVVRLDERGTPPAQFELRMQSDGQISGTWTRQGKSPQSVALR